MIPGFSGNLVTEYFAEEFLEELFGGQLDHRAASRARSSLLRQRKVARDRLGPVCGPRQVHDLVTLPLASTLGFEQLAVVPTPSGALLLASDRNDPHAPVFVSTAWGESLESTWREALRAQRLPLAGWCVSVNGTHLRLDDGRRAFARRFVQFDLDLSFEDERLFSIFWLLLQQDSFARADGEGASEAGAPIDRVVQASDRNTAGVCRSLRSGVLTALSELLGAFVGRRRTGKTSSASLARAHEQSLTIVYRLLFLLFAESRLLVPTWHPVYREGYSLDAARSLAEQAAPATGLWDMLQAISRLSHSGCRAGDLLVTPFNGRLFSPSATPLGEHARLADEPVRRTLLALSTTPRAGGHARIVYRDLDVEQLGAVYESVLDYTPALTASPPRVELRPGSGIRKTTGTFYTPQALTAYLVRRTLAPLVDHASPDRILSLRVVDPAMGSGAFLVAACRYLAAAYETALVEHGRALAGEIDEEDRRGFRRAIAQRCLYGVDSNPMAVQLARLSMWLATLAPDRPLTFLDHRLVVGDSLIGASIDDLLRRPIPGAAHPVTRSASTLPLFDDVAIGPAVRAVLPQRVGVAERADDTLADVREKEKVLAGLAGRRSPLAGWRTVLDLWCAQVGSTRDARLSAGVFAALVDHVLLGRSPLGEDSAERLLDLHHNRLRSLSPLHWSLEFPEIFYGSDGQPLAQPGFDAVIGNPPWDMIRADEDGPTGRPAAREEIAWLLRFSRESGTYRALGAGHPNRFQLFVERAVQLARQGGRIGLVLPWGLFADAGCAPLRRLLFDSTSLDAVVGFDNAARIFPIHRSVRFLAVSATSGGATTALTAHFGARDIGVLDRLPLTGSEPQSFPVAFSRALVERLSGESMAIPDVRSTEDLELLDNLSRAGPPLASKEGWNATFGRELNATEDRKHFCQDTAGLPVLEGKHIESFRAHASAARNRLPKDAAERLLAGTRPFTRARLAYRDVSSPTNRLTLIAAIVPAGCVTVHSLFCLRSPLPLAAQHFLCGILNSWVANYFVRFWVSSHVTTGIIGRLPVPSLPHNSPAFRHVAGLACRLSRAAAPLSHAAYPRLQAEVARLYGLTEAELERVVAGFPLIDAETKERTKLAYRELIDRQPLTAPCSNGFSTP